LSAPSTSDARRFAVALSFPGEYRNIIKRVAKRLASTFGGQRVLYDKFHDAELARPDLDVYLPGLYREQSELLVVVLCPEYSSKPWCQLEWRHIRQLIATVEAKRIMFLSIGDPGDLTPMGVVPGDGYLDVARLTPAEIAQKIDLRYRLNQNVAKLPVATSAASARSRRRTLLIVGCVGSIAVGGVSVQRVIRRSQWDKATASESHAAQSTAAPSVPRADPRVGPDGPTKTPAGPVKSETETPGIALPVPSAKRRNRHSSKSGVVEAAERRDPSESSRRFAVEMCVTKMGDGRQVTADADDDGSCLRKARRTCDRFGQEKCLYRWADAEWKDVSR